VSWVLLSNDDGVDSPALVPFADALERALDLPVHVCVPDGERSWSGKAVTRHGTLRLGHLRRGGRLLTTVSGTPADAVQLGLYAAFAQEWGGAPPAAVVTGINLGFNHGRAFLASSGTVWAAAEAALAGLPAIAVSTGSDDDHAAWLDDATGPGSTTAWERVAGAAAAVVRRLTDSTVLADADLVSVNLPWGVDEHTPRRVTSLAPQAYGPLFEPTDVDGEFTFRTRLDIDLSLADDGADVHAPAAGVVSITPVVLPRSTRPSPDVVAHLEG
jgi:5'-nucleotidase